MHQLRTIRLSGRAGSTCNATAPAINDRQRGKEVAMNRNSPTTIRTVDLGYDQMLILEDRPGARVSVLFGGIWLTEEGSREDVFARGGEVVVLHSRKRALLEGIGPTRVEVAEPAAAGTWRALASTATAATRRLARSLRGADPRQATGALRGTLAALGLLVGAVVPALVVLGMTAAPEAVAALALAAA
jgi:hypothetical protein